MYNVSCLDRPCGHSRQLSQPPIHTRVFWSVGFRTGPSCKVAWCQEHEGQQVLWPIRGVSIGEYNEHRVQSDLHIEVDWACLAFNRILPTRYFNLETKHI